MQEARAKTWQYRTGALEKRIRLSDWKLEWDLEMSQVTASKEWPPSKDWPHRTSIHTMGTNFIEPTIKDE